MLVIRAEKVDGGNILVGYSYAFAADMREADESVRVHLSGSYSKAEMDMAKQLLGALSAANANSLDMEVDEALPMRHMLVQDALAGKVLSAPDAEAVPETAVANLADALSQAIAAANATPEPAAA
jgi:non-homologous end joining protein Ku